MSQDPRFAVERLQSLIAPLLQGQYSSEMRKVSIYVESVSKSLDSARAALEALKEKGRRIQIWARMITASAKIR